MPERQHVPCLRSLPGDENFCAQVTSHVSLPPDAACATTRPVGRALEAWGPPEAIQSWWLGSLYLPLSPPSKLKNGPGPRRAGVQACRRALLLRRLGVPRTGSWQVSWTRGAGAPACPSAISRLCHRHCIALFSSLHETWNVAVGSFHHAEELRIVIAHRFQRPCNTAGRRNCGLDAPSFRPSRATVVLPRSGWMVAISARANATAPSRHLPSPPSYQRSPPPLSQEAMMTRLAIYSRLLD